MIFHRCVTSVLLLGSLSFCLSVSALPALAANAPALPAPIETITQPLIWNSDKRGDVTAGHMTFAGGIEISSMDKRFGGWSGLAISRDGGSLVAVSDEGRWLSAKLLYDEKDRLSGLAQAIIAPMLDSRGEALEGKQLADAEGLAISGADITKGLAYVSFERAHRIWRYDLSQGGFTARPEQLLTQREFGRLASNSGIEALEVLHPTPTVPKPRLLAITEDSRDPRGNLIGFIANGKKIIRFALKPDEPYKPTDMARLPDGDVLLLERRYSPLAGVGMKVVLLRGSDFRPGAVIKGTELAEISQRYAIDNMEGMAVRRDDRGTIWLYMISDDNFSPLQRTLLLMFKLDPKTLKPRHSPAGAE